MSPVHFQQTYLLNDTYPVIRQRAGRVLGGYLDDPALFAFDDLKRSLTFTSERLIPTAYTGRPRVMLLFSNPHPHSIRQGMFLSPNTRGQESLFWRAMRDAGWMDIEENTTPAQRAQICLAAGYQGPFDLIFHCYYAFPTAYPEEIREMFGEPFFSQVIEPEARDAFRRTLRETGAQAVVTFNKGIFNLVAAGRIERYVQRLIGGELIQSQVAGVEGAVPIYLTFPTGWRYHRDHRRCRQASLEAIRAALLKEN